MSDSEDNSRNDTERESAPKSSIPRRGLPQRLVGSLWYGEPFRPKRPVPTGFTFDDRASLIADLLALRTQGDRSFDVWVARAIARLSAEPKAFAELAKPLKKIQQAAAAKGTAKPKPPSKRTPEPVVVTAADGQPANDPPPTEVPPDSPPDPRVIQAHAAEVTQVIDAAIALAERHPVAGFGRDMRALVAEETESAIQNSAAARIARWLAPLIVAGLLGGTILGGIRVDGLLAQVRSQQAEADAKLKDALTAFNLTLAQHVSTDVKQIVDGTTAAYTRQMESEIRNVPNFVSTEEARLRSTAEQTINDKTKDVTNALDQKKSEISQALDTARTGIDAALGTKRTAVEKSLDTLNAAIVAQTGALATAVADFRKATSDRLADMPTKIAETAAKVGQIDTHLSDLQKTIGDLQTATDELHKLNAAIASPTGASTALGDYLWTIRWQTWVATAAAIFSAAMLAANAILLRRTNRSPAET
jgi:hypothetical protein